MIRQMAGKFQDEQIAATLNRLALRTGTGQSWSENRVYSARHYHQLPAYDANHAGDGLVTMEEAAQRLGVSSTSIRRLIKLKKVPANQVVACAPWQIPIEALESEEVRQAVRNIKARVSVPRTQGGDKQQAMFSMFREITHSVAGSELPKARTFSRRPIHSHRASSTTNFLFSVGMSTSRAETRAFQRGGTSPPGQAPASPVAWGQAWRGTRSCRSRPDT